MSTLVSFVSGHRTGRAARTGARETTAELVALHTHLVLRFRSMATQHRSGCAYVAPYPSCQDCSPNEILVIPERSGAALFSIGFLQGNPTTMVVRIGEHGIVMCAEEAPSTLALAATAERLFGIALAGSYREEILVQPTTGRYEGGQSYVLDESQGWKELGCLNLPRLPARLLRHKLAVLDRLYEPY